MADTAQIWYYVKGNLDVASLFVSPNETIEELMNRIYKVADKAFPEWDVQDIILTKVRYIMISTNAAVTMASAVLLHP